MKIQKSFGDHSNSLPQTNGYPHHSQSYSHQRSSSVSHTGNGVAPVTNGSNNRAPAMAGPDDDDDYDRGHWGSKAEFILSCVGFSVSYCLILNRANILLGYKL